MRVSVSSTGAQGNGDGFQPAISADARTVAFVSSATDLIPRATVGPAVFVHDLKTGHTQPVSLSSTGAPGNSTSLRPAVSPDGRMVVFESFASNLVAGHTNGSFDVFLRDLKRHTTTRVSVSSHGGHANNDSFLPSMSADGHVIAFESTATRDTNGAEDVFIRGPLNH
jgi:Tol biopolymer transport system component